MMNLVKQNQSSETPLPAPPAMPKKHKKKSNTPVHLSHLQPTVGSVIFDIFNVAFMIFVIAVTLLPLLHVLWVSFSDAQEVAKGGFFLYPKGFNLNGYKTALKHPLLGRSYLNTIFYAVMGTTFTLFFTALTAYPLSVRDFVLKRFVTVFLTITMFISGGVVPSYLLMRELKLIDSPWVMIIPGCVGAYNVILFRTFFTGVGGEIRESARIDGAGEFRILAQIIVPLSKPIFATVGLFTIVGKWNSWYDALIYLNNAKLHPLQMILRSLLFTTQATTEMQDPVTRELLRSNKLNPANIKMATIVLATAPLLCIYPFIQKYFVKGIFVGSIKG